MQFTSLSLADIGRTQHVKRWHIVDMIKDQSVAEHSYMVAMIAANIAHKTGYSDLIQNQAITMALIHDATEGITGDVPSPVKGWVSGYSELEKKLDPCGTDFRDAAQQLVHRIVKMADLIEAIHHLEKYGIRGRTRDYTVKTLRSKLTELWTSMKGEIIPSGKNWGDIISEIQLDLDCSRLTIVEEACDGCRS